MESVSPTEKPSEPPSSPFAPIVGTVIALLTLTVPIVAIAHYSASDPLLVPLQTYPFTPSTE
jgi:hypothetical protein